MPVEDFTTYTEVDPSGDITVTSTRVTADTMHNNIDAYVADDKGVGHFSGDYEHLLDVNLTSIPVGFPFIGFWTLANYLNGFNNATPDGDSHNIIAFGSPPAFRIYEISGGTIFADSSFEPTENTTYYLKVKRDESVSFGTLSLFIYSDSGRTTLLDTLSVALHEKEDWRYVYAAQSRSDSGDQDPSSWTQNLDLRVPVTILPSVQTATFSIPTPALSLGVKVLPSTQAATFSIPTLTLSLGVNILTETQTATFSLLPVSAFSIIINPNAPKIVRQNIIPNVNHKK